MITHEIIGDDMQAVVLTLGSGGEVRAEAGAMTYMTDGIEMDARMQGGLLGGLKRKIAGRGELLPDLLPLHHSVGPASPSGGPYPGKIIRMPLAEQRRALPARFVSLCRRRCQHQRRVHRSGSVPAFSAGKASSCSVSKARAKRSFTAAAPSSRWSCKAGERLRVDTGCLVAFDPTVDYDIQFVGGIKTALFGGEGLFFAAVTGPGRVWIQTLPFSRLADRFTRRAAATARTSSATWAARSVLWAI